MRIEVQVTTPHFEIQTLDRIERSRELGKDRKLRYAIIGSERSRQETFAGKERQRITKNDDEDRGEEDESDNEDAVGWMWLLKALHERQKVQLRDTGRMGVWLAEEKISANIRAWLGPRTEELEYNRDAEVYFGTLFKHQTAIVSLQRRTRSWDLMPPEVVRPLASTTLGTLISIAHRMGMVWLDLKPSDGKLRAEGNGQSFSATVVRGLGLVVDYHRERAQDITRRRDLLHGFTVPTIESDKVSTD